MKRHVTIAAIATAILLLSISLIKLHSSSVPSLQSELLLAVRENPSLPYTNNTAQETSPGMVYTFNIEGRVALVADAKSIRQILTAIAPSNKKPIIIPHVLGQESAYVIVPMSINGKTIPFIYLEPVKETGISEKDMANIARRAVIAAKEQQEALLADNEKAVNKVGIKRNIGITSVSATYGVELVTVIEYNSQDNYAPMGRIKVAYRVYKVVSEVDPQKDYYIVVQHATAYPGYLLNKLGLTNYDSSWEINYIGESAAVDIDSTTVFTIDDYDPNNSLDKYNDINTYTFAYTVGPAPSIGVTVTYEMQAFRLLVLDAGEDYVVWLWDLNREDYHDKGVGREQVTVEPGIFFSMNLNEAKNYNKVHQKYDVGVEFVKNRSGWFDDHVNVILGIMLEWILQ